MQKLVKVAASLAVALAVASIAVVSVFAQAATPDYSVITNGVNSGAQGVYTGVGNIMPTVYAVFGLLFVIGLSFALFKKGKKGV